MNTEFRIVLLSDDPYHSGLLKGYCHVHRYKIFEATTANREPFPAIIQLQPNLIIFAMGLAHDQSQKTDIDLIREASINQKIPVCYLRDIKNVSSLDKDAASWIDLIMDAPLDLNQLDDYLINRFQHHHLFIHEKRNRARRAANDRRRLMLEQNNGATQSHQAIQRIAKVSDGNYFIVEPFQIDLRSKCVLLHGKSLHLTRKEFELFELLAKDVDRVFMTDEIINHVWPENNRVTKSDLYQYMHLLRKKVEKDPNNPQWILTVKGFGYKLNLPSFAKANPPTSRGMKLVNNFAQ